ncbi:DEAD-box ATP-dependent RNA helicase 1-like isoform X2 [Brassica napus]|uniref:DEAD-box ATP-dependent RNA helicase 1 isoform X2 n=1 Tax=Brassica oleracea var. oleracea TaxID=109376 RepID=UPI0006A6D94B|nr:PREDICTED: DEAD-box ATP-dependent RNA helicase 1 isoform X2 [Brassica oleracea var. oleracea]XP_048602129.1 DEAD-box ATP-dependent RNA helicase 1-like isoform X2 [Brassica napus]
MVVEEKDGQAQAQEETTNLVVPWMRAPVDVSHVDSCSLETLPSLHPRLKEALEKMGISSLFPVQVAVWHETIGPGGFERDVCVNSPTGSGKTLSYALPIVQTLSSRAVRCLRALVVLPTRDLALQVKGVFDAIAPSVGLSVGSAVGQSSIAGDIAQLIKTPKLDAGICYDPEDISQNLESSAVDILVATPGRLMDHINNTKGFTLEHLRYLVVDETDRLLRESYQEWLPTVLKLTQASDDGPFPSSSPFVPSSFGSLLTIRRHVERGFKGKPYPRLAKLALSATLTQDPSKLIQLDLHHPLFMTTGATRYRLPEKLECLRLICETGVKPVYLVGLLKSLEGEKCIVFTSSVETTRRLCKLLNFFGDSMIKAKEYSGGLNQAVRSKELKAFRKGDIQVLISSDALARGMDVELVTNVINYDMPQYPKTFIHRAGRTARAGRAGRCFTLLGDHEVRRFSNLLKKVGNASCPIYPIPPDLFGPVRAIYEPALAKLKESVEPIAPKRGRQVGFKHNSKTTNSQTKRNKATSGQA